MRINIFFFCFLLSSSVFTQERLGLSLGNYAGVNSLTLNPTGNHYNPLKWDINLIGAGIFFDNNYAFIRQTSVLNLYHARNEANFELADYVEGNVPNNTYVVDFFDLNRSRYGTVDAFIKGPSVAIRFKENHSIAVFTGARFAAGTQDLPNNFSYKRYQERGLNSPFQIHPFTAALLSWMETGINYAIKIPSPTGSVGFGINLRWLRAFEGAYVSEMEEFQITKLTGTSLTMRESRGYYAFTNSNLKNNGHKPVRNGSGLGVDLGFVKFIGGDEDEYKLRVGASLIDLGFISYNKNSEVHKIRVDSLATLNAKDYEIIQGPEEFHELVELYSLNTMGDANASFYKDKFTVGLPAAFSLQADLALKDNLFVNATLVQRLRPLGNSAERTNILAITPRYEDRWLSASMPFVLLNYDQFNLGLALRLGFLTVGSDNVTSLFGKRNFSGSDIYLALKVNPFDIGSGGRNSRSSRKGVKCYDF